MQTHGIGICCGLWVVSGLAIADVRPRHERRNGFLTSSAVSEHPGHRIVHLPQTFRTPLAVEVG